MDSNGWCLQSNRKIQLKLVLIVLYIFCCLVPTEAHPQHVNSLHSRIAAATTRNSILKMDVDTITLFVHLFTTNLKPAVQDFGS